MRFKGHIIIGLACGVLAFTLTKSFWPGVEDEMLFLIIASVFIGNIGPDISEFGIIEHRTYTHYPPLYLSILLLLICAANFQLEQMVEFKFLVLIFAYSIGCLIHLVCDFPYGGLPYIWPTRKITIIKIPLVGPINTIIEASLTVFILYLAFTFY